MPVLYLVLFINIGNYFPQGSFCSKYAGIQSGKTVNTIKNTNFAGNFIFSKKDAVFHQGMNGGYWRNYTRRSKSYE